jgi:hypothetical protein
VFRLLHLVHHSTATLQSNGTLVKRIPHAIHKNWFVVQKQHFT